MRDAWFRVLVYFGLAGTPDAPRTTPRVYAIQSFANLLLAAIWTAYAARDPVWYECVLAVTFWLLTAANIVRWRRERRPV